MANVLSKDKQIAVTAALAEGSGIRSIERMTGIHRDTIMRLGVLVGQGCARLLDEKCTVWIATALNWMRSGDLLVKRSVTSAKMTIRLLATFGPTSYVERLNASTRLHVKRLNRLTLAFSKKFENFEAAVSLHFGLTISFAHIAQ
jgi:IS1 family transposase